MTSVTEEYMNLTSGSKELYDRACKVFPSGSTRAPFFHWPYPTYTKQAEGCRIWDVDGREYIDYVNNYGPLILGHRHPKVIGAVKEQLELLWVGGPSESEVMLAEKIVEQVPCAEQILFCASGSEADMNAMRLCRAYTGRDKIAMFEGAYHGSMDILYPQTGSGIPKDHLGKLIFMPFNDVEAVEKIVKNNKEELAAIFVEPTMGAMGHEPPREGFLKVLREVTEENDVLLVFDEVVTGFRLGPGGAQERFGAIPDVVVLGKIIGGGFACGAFGASIEKMKLFAYPKMNSLELEKPPLCHPGTYNEQKIAMVAGLATINQLTPSAYEHLEKIGQSLRDGLKKICSDLKITAQITGVGSIFWIVFTDEEIVNPRSVLTANPLLIRIFDNNMRIRGIRVGNAHASFCSLPMARREVKQTLQAAEQTLAAMKPIIGETAPHLLR